MSVTGPAGFGSKSNPGWAAQCYGLWNESGVGPSGGGGCGLGGNQTNKLVEVRDKRKCNTKSPNKRRRN